MPSISAMLYKIFGARSAQSIVTGYEYEVRSLLRRLSIDMNNLAKIIDKSQRKEQNMAKKKTAKKAAKKSAKKSK